jgi:hypothetical protein
MGKDLRKTIKARMDAQRYEVKVEAADMGFWGKYRLTICRGALCWGPEDTHCWYGRNAEKLQRKGDRLAKRLNRNLDKKHARQSALDAT